MPSATVTTVDPNSELNPIPYDVGEMIALPGGWRVDVERVQRSGRVTGLPAPADGNDYVTVDVRVVNEAGPRVTFAAEQLFVLYDQANNPHPVVALPGTADHLDGAFPVGSDRTGKLVFSAPARSQLLMILDGQKLSSQRSVFQIDPPKATPRD